MPSLLDYYNNLRRMSGDSSVSPPSVVPDPPPTPEQSAYMNKKYGVRIPVVQITPERLSALKKIYALSNDPEDRRIANTLDFDANSAIDYKRNTYNHILTMMQGPTFNGSYIPYWVRKAPDVLDNDREVWNSVAGPAKKIFTQE